MLEVLKPLLQTATVRIRNNVRRFSATGKTLQSIKYELFQDGGQIVANKSIVFIERGRGPAKKSTPKWPWQTLLEWMKIRGIGTDLSEKRRESLAKFIKYKINQEGTRTWKKGRGEVVNNVYTDVVEELSNDVERVLTKELEKNFNLNFKGKNVTVN